MENCKVPNRSSVVIPNKFSSRMAVQESLNCISLLRLLSISIANSSWLRYRENLTCLFSLNRRYTFLSSRRRVKAITVIGYSGLIPALTSSLRCLVDFLFFSSAHANIDLLLWFSSIYKPHSVLFKYCSVYVFWNIKIHRDT